MTCKNSAQIDPPGCIQALHPPETPSLRGVFDAFDKNQDGLLTMQELSSWMEKCGLHSSADALLQMVDDFDLDRDQCLNFEEFLALNKMLENEGGDLVEVNEDGSSNAIDPKTREENDMRESFRVFDKDGNGQISPEELKGTLSDLGFLAEGTALSRIYSMIRKVDADGDGQVNFAEFQSMMKRN